MHGRRLFSLLIAFFVILCFLQITSFAEIDMKHNYKEELQLLDENWYVGHCRNGKATCIKNLIRYDGLEEFNNFLKDLEKNAEDEKEERFWMPLLEKALIGTGGCAWIYLVPITAIFGSIILGSIAHHVHDNVIDPIGEIAGYFPKSFIRFKDWIFRVKKPENPDKGLFGNAKDTLFGDKTKENLNEGLLEAIRKLIFGDKIVTILSKHQKQAFVKGIRNELYQQIKDKKWVNNDFLFLCIDIDPKVMEYGLKFDNVSFPLSYKASLKSYFKRIK